MGNDWFRFKKFTIHQGSSAMKVTTDSCVFGAWVSSLFSNNFTESSRLLDIGTGTGLLALMLAQAGQGLIDAVEIDAGACRNATENFSASGFSGRIQLFQEPAETFSPECPYQLIICNPPFYENDLRGPSVEKNRAHHESGLNLKSMIELIAKWLDGDGCAAVLVPHRREAELLTLIEAARLYPAFILRMRQSPNHQFFRTAIAFHRSSDKPFLQTEVIIRDGMDAYTPEFRALLYPYYLNF